MRTLADLLKEDNALEGDVYEACGNSWKVDRFGHLHHWSNGAYLDVILKILPADGWKRVTPKKPLRVEFETTVGDFFCGVGMNMFGVKDTLIGRRVKVIVEETE